MPRSVNTWLSGPDPPPQPFPYPFNLQSYTLYTCICKFGDLDLGLPCPTNLNYVAQINVVIITILKFPLQHFGNQHEVLKKFPLVCFFSSLEHFDFSESTVTLHLWLLWILSGAAYNYLKHFWSLQYLGSRRKSLRQDTTLKKKSCFSQWNIGSSVTLTIYLVWEA